MALARKPIEVRYETIGCWTLKFGPMRRFKSQGQAQRFLSTAVCNCFDTQPHLIRRPTLRQFRAAAHRAWAAATPAA
jgi:hypothetical protein